MRITLSFALMTFMVFSQLHSARADDLRWMDVPPLFTVVKPVPDARRQSSTVERTSNISTNVSTQRATRLAVLSKPVRTPLQPSGTLRVHSHAEDQTFGVHAEYSDFRIENRYRTPLSQQHPPASSGHAVVEPGTTFSFRPATLDSRLHVRRVF